MTLWTGTSDAGLPSALPPLDGGEQFNERVSVAVEDQPLDSVSDPEDQPGSDFRWDGRFLCVGKPAEGRD